MLGKASKSLRIPQTDSSARSFIRSTGQGAECLTCRVHKRIAIVNRGEAAVRLIHAVAELAEAIDDGEQKPVTIALHTAAEQHAMFVRLADEAVEISTADGANPYLDYDAIVRGLNAARADAAWVGWGFVAEHPEFADRCAQEGVTFIGPSGDVMRQLGDKIGAKRLAEANDVPVAAWSNGPVADVAAAAVHAEAIGYPLMIKATAGGGGRGIRMVERAEELDDAFERASGEAERSFGDATVFMERVVRGARHVEVQIVADTHGNAWALGVRDCSLQRRNQKVIEESTSSALSAEQNTELGAAAVRLAKAAGYTNVGTVEFLYQPDDESFAFLEVNTRLQVEHPVTELTTGFDLVKMQLQMAAGWELDGDPPAPTGHAIEARLNAEDPDRGFTPAPGPIDLLRFPSGPGIRVDTGVAEGDTIPPDYDSMIAKIIAWAPTRAEALARLRRAIGQTTVVIGGAATNKSFLLDILNRPEVADGAFDTQWLDRLTADGPQSPAHSEIALVAAAIDAWETEAANNQRAFYASAGRGRPKADAPPERKFECRYRGENYGLAVARVSPRQYIVTLDGHTVHAIADRIGRSGMHVWIGGGSSAADVGHRYRVTATVDGTDHIIEVDGVTHRVSRDDGGLLRAPAPALVVAVAVSVGDQVTKGSPLVVLESMKVETPVLAPFDATVADVAVSANVQVDAAAPLVRLEPLASADEGAAPSGRRVGFGELGPADADEHESRQQLLDLLASMRWHVLGFDLGSHGLRSPSAIAATYDELRSDVEIDDEIVNAELAILNAFADIATLSRNRPADAQSEVDAHSPQEYFHRYLRSLDVETEGLPASFRQRLVGALAHYGIGTELEHTPELEQASYGLFIAQQRASDCRPLLLALLSREAPEAGELSPAVTADFRRTLDNVMEATELRHPIVGNMARNCRYRCFDEPLIEAINNEAIGEVRLRLDLLADEPDQEERAAIINELARSPQRLIRLMVDKDDDGFFCERFPLVEVLTRRNYQIRDLEEFRHGRFNDESLLTTSYNRDDGRRHVIAALASAEQVGTVFASMAAVAKKAPAEDITVLDLYVRWGELAIDADALGGVLLTTLTAVDLPPWVARVSVSGASVDGTVHHFTFRQGSDGLSEDLAIRGVHPMVAQRLQIWRLENFDLTRLPSPEDTHLFAGTAHANARDRRLFAAAEIRNFTPIRDEDGRLIGLPEFERVLSSCLEGLRAARTMFTPNEAPVWNRILLYIWPVVDLSMAEIAELSELLAPLTQGLGLEDVRVQAKVQRSDGTNDEVILKIADVAGAGVQVDLLPIPIAPLEPLDDYTRNVLSARRRGAPYPYELIPALTRDSGTFIEYDVAADGGFEPVEREPGQNNAGIIAGLVSTPTSRYPEGMQRVALLGDPTKSLGSISEAECRIILGALDLAELIDAPVEWFAVSAGAKVAMDSGTENMDWISRVLRRIIEFTQDGREINIVVTGINVGAQPYWNAEATMLAHTKGILVMTPESAMVLTGKQALDYSGGVSAEDNFGIGGYDRIMGPNGQAQYWAADLAGACDVLFAHYEHCYVAPGEQFPRPAETNDPRDRDARDSPHVVEGVDFTTVGDVWSDETNPGRKKPFDIRAVMHAVIDNDLPPLERWAAMRDAESVVALDAHLGGHPIALLGIESRPMPRFGLLPADGPDQWTAGTLFPLSSKKAARAINAASGSRPLVVLANLSGFDGSPESLRRLQLEYGAEIGRAVVNFDGPIVFCVISRYHGGAFVVFSGALNDNMQVLAVDGTHASVLGGAPAAAVVFAGEVRRRVSTDPRITELQAREQSAGPVERVALRAELAELTDTVRSEKLGEVATEFDTIHSVERAMEVGSVDRIIPAAEIRPILIDAIEAGMAKAADRAALEIG